jgi:pimeloyl-ACP methyl ester carboxylesterase
MRIAIIIGLLCIGSVSIAADVELPPIPPIKRLLPPPGIEIPAEVRSELEAKLKTLAPRVKKISNSAHRADIEIFTKAVDFALRFGEFYDAKDFDKARWALEQAAERLAGAENREAPWLRQTGLVVRGNYSRIDGSVQPYGQVIHKDFDFNKVCTQIVFLHGRGDKQTDLHFLHERAHKQGEVPATPETIVIHPFGRHCLGFKSAGEIDVLDASTGSGNPQYLSQGVPVLMGFSMGGAGAWHVGAHYPRFFSAISPGAGFVDVARYQRLKPENYPPAYEQKLWGIYDVPAYTRTLFNLPVIAYSGELDKQKDAADFMAEAFRQEGRELRHLIGPQTEHKYHPEVKQELLAQLHAALEQNVAARSKPQIEPEAHLQTRTLRYNSAAWFTAYGLEEHWQDARLDGTLKFGRFDVTTKNITRFSVHLFAAPPNRTFVVDGKTIDVLPADEPESRRTSGFYGSEHFERKDGRWQSVPPFVTKEGNRLRGKSPQMQGPIDDAFLDPFLVVLPSGKSMHPRVQQWIDFEIAHLRERWAATFRGELPVKLDTKVTDNDMKYQHIVCFGDPTSNVVLKRALEQLPVKWDQKTLTFNGQSYEAATHVPLMIYPNPLQPPTPIRRAYIVLNSGPTFREAHDRTNSLQNPKLPDWAIVDVTTPPDGEKPGKVVAADFFDEEWKVKAQIPNPNDE